MNTVLADYQGPRDAFAVLCAEACTQRILLLHGEGGTGKTSLIKYFLTHTPAGMEKIPFELRGGTVGVAEIFSRSAEFLDWEMPHFRRQAHAIAPQVNLDEVQQEGEHNQINVILGNDPEQRAQHRAALTAAWFKDMRALTRPLLLVLDTYEKAVTEVAEWISGPFLARVARCTPLRVVVAGREVPAAGGEWGHCCVSHSLLGVREAEHWWPVVEALKVQIPGAADRADAMTWLAGVCHALEGNPDRIIRILNDLPRASV